MSQQLLMKSEEIYLLYCLVKTQGIGVEFSHSSIEFSKQYGVTLSTVTSLFSTLKKTQSVIVKEQYSLKGRGQNVYTLTKSTLLNHDEFGLLKKVIQTDNLVVFQLLKNDLSGLTELTTSGYSNDNSKKKRQPFRASNRLFLALLLLHANELGVVDNMSSTYIRKLMGHISAARFKSQLTTLKELGLMREHVSGLTGKELFGRTKGSYYLNIEHPFLKSSFDEVSLLLLDFNRSIYRYNESTEVKCLFDAYAHAWCIRGQKIDLGKLDRYQWSEAIGGVMEVFPTRFVIHFFRNKALHDQIHQWVCQVASEFILKQVTSYESLNINQCSHRLIELLSFSKSIPMTKQHEVFGSLSASRKVKLKLNKVSYLADVLSLDEPDLLDEEPLSYWQYVMLTRLIVALGLNMAARYKKLLALSGIKSTNVEHCAILPLKEEVGFCFQYEIRFIQPDEQQRIVLLTVHDKEQVSLKISGEQKKVEPQIRIQDIHRAFRSNSCQKQS